MTSLRDRILAAKDLPSKKIHVDLWHEDVWVRSLTGAERDEFEASCVAGNGPDRARNVKNLRARFVALCLVDGEGQRIFAFEDAAALGNKNGDVLSMLFAEAQNLNGLTEADVQLLAGN